MAWPFPVPPITDPSPTVPDSTIKQYGRKNTNSLIGHLTLGRLASHTLQCITDDWELQAKRVSLKDFTLFKFSIKETTIIKVKIPLMSNLPCKGRGKQLTPISTIWISSVKIPRNVTVTGSRKFLTELQKYKQNYGYTHMSTPHTHTHKETSINFKTFLYK